MRLFHGFFLAAALLLTPAMASAQYGGFTQPRVSPYLNLLRAGSPPGVNYYDLVRPQIDNRAAILQLQQQGLANQQAIAGLEANTPLTTGHPFGFQNHMRYFNNLGSGGAGLTQGLAVGTRAAGATQQQPSPGGSKGGGGSRH
jgi:hypothetical protein